MPEIVRIKIARPNEPQIVLFKVGFRGGDGPPTIGGAQISPEPENRLEVRPNGLFVGPPVLSSAKW